MGVWRNKNKLLATQILSDKIMDGVGVSTSGLLGIDVESFCIQRKYLGRFLGLLSLFVLGQIFRWFNYFSVVGYNYNVRANGRRQLLSIYVGLVYRIVICVPASVKLLVGKRKMFMVSDNLVELKLMGGFVRNLRNLLP
jgi:hypothetical protein